MVWVVVVVAMVGGARLVMVMGVLLWELVVVVRVPPLPRLLLVVRGHSRSLREQLLISDATRRRHQQRRHRGQGVTFSLEARTNGEVGCATSSTAHTERCARERECSVMRLRCAREGRRRGDSGSSLHHVRDHAKLRNCEESLAT